MTLTEAIDELNDELRALRIEVAALPTFGDTGMRRQTLTQLLADLQRDVDALRARLTQ